MEREFGFSTPAHRPEAREDAAIEGSCREIELLTERVAYGVWQGEGLGLLQWLPGALRESFGLQDCQLERYDSRQQTVYREQQDGAERDPDVCYQVERLWDIYEPLLAGRPVQLVPQKLSWWRAPTSLTWLGCPIFDRHLPWGFIWLARSPQTYFSEVEQRQLQRIALYCAIAIEHAHLRQTLEQQQAQIVQLQQSKDEFLQLISHELLTPISSIQLSAQTLEKIFMTASWRKASQQHTALRTIHLLNQECRRQSQLVSNLMTLMFPERQRRPEPVLIALGDWLPSVLRTFETQAQQQELQLNLQFAKGLPTLECDAKQLEKALSELLVNAVKFTPSGESITVTASADEGSVRISIANTGVVIPPQHREHIFDRFYRVPTVAQLHQRGAGLGLALVQQIMTNLGGSIDLGGDRHTTTFTLTLPLSPTS